MSERRRRFGLLGREFRRELGEWCDKADSEQTRRVIREELDGFALALLADLSIGRHDVRARNRLCGNNPRSAVPVAHPTFTTATVRSAGVAAVMVARPPCE